MDLKHNVMWQVSLSNGETFLEGKPPFQEIPKIKSPWQRLISYTVQKEAVITSLSLITGDRSYNLPSSGKNPKFKPFADAPKPIDYHMFRSLAREIDIVNREAKNIKTSDHFTVAEAIYPDHKLQIWVDERNTRNSWTLVVKND